MHTKRILFAAFTGASLFSCVLLCSGPARAQESVADAARKAQAEKKSTAKPATVFTNDDIANLKGTISVVGETPTGPVTPAAPQKAKTPAVDDKTKDSTADDKSKAPANDDKSAAISDDKAAAAKGEDYWKKIFADARKKLADDAHELDILQREYNLKQQQYYADPNQALREQYSRKDIDDTKTKIDEKTAAVAQDKQAISDLEDQLRQAGGEPGWANQ